MSNARAKLITPAKIAAAMSQTPATLIPFDVISVNGKSLCAKRLLQRKKHLSEIVSNEPSLMLPTYFIGDGQGLFDWTLANQLEGIVTKHVSSTYRINRRPDRLEEAWVKRKHTETTEAYFLGYQVNPFALVVGLDDCVPAALVEIGFQAEENGISENCTADPYVEAENTRMIEPFLKCNCEHLERTNNFKFDSRLN